MSTADITSTKTSLQNMQLTNARPSFVGLIGGELFKMTRQLATWIMAIVLAVLVILPYLIAFALQRATNELQAEPVKFLVNWFNLNAILLRATSGFILIILTARVIGLEYNLGTIRILLARGVGRMQLLLAKLIALVIWAIGLLLLGLILSLLLTLLLVQVKTGSLNGLHLLSSTDWQHVATEIEVIGISMGATILLATVLTVLGRSMAFGMSLALIWFPVDNILVGILALVGTLTANIGPNSIWFNITAYLLGPNINALTALLNGSETGFGSVPLITIDATHALVVTLVYSAIFAIAAFVLTARRDVKD
jgi:ABC-type transport system involved in multi-copper enzyme maturation permease subunit